MPIKHYGDEIAFSIPNPTDSSPKALGKVEQEVFDVLDALHTQAMNALPHDSTMVLVLSRAMDKALEVCPRVAPR